MVNFSRLFSLFVNVGFQVTSSQKMFDDCTLPSSKCQCRQCVYTAKINFIFFNFSLPVLAVDSKHIKPYESMIHHVSVHFLDKFPSQPRLPFFLNKFHLLVFRSKFDRLFRDEESRKPNCAGRT